MAPRGMQRRHPGRGHRRHRHHLRARRNGSQGRPQVAHLEAQALGAAHWLARSRAIPDHGLVHHEWHEESLRQATT